MYCKYCGNEIKDEEEVCSKCGEDNPDYRESVIEEIEEIEEIKNKKRFIMPVLVIGVTILIFVAMALNSPSNVKTTTQNNNTSTSNSNNTTNATDDKPEQLIFDAKKLVNANKQDVDILLNIKGEQDENETYVYHYGEDIDVAFDDNGKCLNLCLSTKSKGYKSVNESKVLKSYGIDTTDSYYKQSNEFIKNYTKIKDFGEVEVFYDSNKGGSTNNIAQIVFYTKSSKAYNDFVENKSEDLENESSSTNSNSTVKQTGVQQVGQKEYSKKSDLYNKYSYELETLEGATQNLIGINKNNVNTCYEQYNGYINRLWNDLKKQYTDSQFQQITEDENKWIQQKISKYPTCDSENGTFKDKYGAIEMTDERIGVLLKYLK